MAGEFSTSTTFVSGNRTTKGRRWTDLEGAVGSSKPSGPKPKQMSLGM